MIYLFSLVLKIPEIVNHESHSHPFSREYSQGGQLNTSIYNQLY